MGTNEDQLFQALEDNNNSEVTIHHYFVDDVVVRHTGILIQFTDADTNVTSQFTIDVTTRGEDRLQELLQRVFWHAEAEMVVNQSFPGQQSRNYKVTEAILRLPLDGQQNRRHAISKVENLLQKTSHTYNVLTNNCRDHSGRQIQEMCSDNQCDPNAVREAENNLQEMINEDALWVVFSCSMSFIVVSWLIYRAIEKLLLFLRSYYS